MRYEELVSIIASIANGIPEEWDNSGTQIDPLSPGIGRVLVCLDVTEEVALEAEELGVDLVISHHPLFFHGVKTLRNDDGHHRTVMRLVRSGIGVYAAHLTFDKATYGNSWYVGDLLGLKNMRPAGPFDNPLPMVVGDLETPVFLEQLHLYVADMLALGQGEIRSVGTPGTEIQRVAICTGAGADMMEAALEEGCHALITGDMTFHHGLRAKELGLCVIDAGHYGTEKLFTENFGAQLRERVGNQLEVFESTVNTNPFSL